MKVYPVGSGIKLAVAFCPLFPREGSSWVGQCSPRFTMGIHGRERAGAGRGSCLADAAPRASLTARLDMDWGLRRKFARKNFLFKICNVICG